MSLKIQSTTNYSLLEMDNAHVNRDLNLPKHKRLRESMERYGFLECYPVVVVRDADGVLRIRDGQHRHHFAQELGLTVSYVISAKDFDVGVVNSAALGWSLIDYARKHAAHGLEDYVEGLEFCESNRLPLGVGFALLAGTTSYSNIAEAFVDGSFEIEDREWADAVVGIYRPLAEMGPGIKNARFLQACMAVCRVDQFDSRRLLQAVKRCRDKLVAYSTRDAYLDMLEQVYNYGHARLFGLKNAAVMAMRERSVVRQAANGKASPEVAAK